MKIAPRCVAMVFAALLGSAALASEDVKAIQHAADLYNAERYSEAFARFLEMARRGSTDAQRRVAQMYVEGKGTPRDYSQAINWYRKSAEKGDLGALLELGEVYEMNSVHGSPELAYAMYAIGASLGGQLSTEHRDRLEKTLTPIQLQAAQQLSASWQKGRPLPVLPH